MPEHDLRELANVDKAALRRLRRALQAAADKITWRADGSPYVEAQHGNCQEADGVAACSFMENMLLDWIDEIDYHISRK